MPLFSQVEGKKENPALVFLHGFLGNTHDWKETVNHLKKNYYCICIDLPGHGHSVTTNPPLENGFAYCHRLIKEKLLELKVQKYTLIGYSLGGRIALDYARTQNDENLQNLILESAHIGLASQQAQQQRYQHDLNWAKRFATQNITQSLYEWYEQDVFHDLSSVNKDFIINKRSHNYGVCLAGMLLSTSLAKQSNAMPFLQSNSTHTKPLSIYYCFGEKDIKFQSLASSLSSLNNIKVSKFHGAGHNIHQQRPLQYAQFIMKYII